MGEGVIEQAKKAPGAFWDFCKKYWFMGPIIVLVLMGIGMALKPWFTNATTSAGSSTKGNRLPVMLRSVLKISGFLLPIGAVLYAANAFAGVGHTSHQICCAEQVGGFLELLKQTWHILATGAGTGIMFGISHLSAPDVLDAKTENNGDNISYTPGAASAVALYLKTGQKNHAPSGKPYIATSSTVAIDTTVEQVSTGTNPILNQDLARLIDYLEISSPFHGPILDKETGTGPILDLVISFIGEAFGRHGDAPIVTITVPSSAPNDVAVTKYFNFPWVQKYLWEPQETAPWLGLLDNAKFRVGIAADTALAAVSTGSNTKSASVVRSWTSYCVSPEWRQSYLPYWRLDKPASGTNGITFKNFGEAGSPATVPIDIVHTIGMLSNLKGLPGNLTFDTLSEIIAPDFGLDDVTNIDGLVRERIQAQAFGRTGGYGYDNGGNHVQGTAATNGGMSLANLLFLFFRQPQLDMEITNMIKLTAKTQLSARLKTTSTRTGEDAFIVGALRKLTPGKLAEANALSGGLMPPTYDKARNMNAGASR
jgi:hypothetical protein